MIGVNKLLAHKGICSRREAMYYIKNGMVLINDKIFTSKVYEFQPNENEDSIRVDLTNEGKEHKLHQNISILYHKPVGIVCGKNRHGYITARDMLVPENQWIPEVDANNDTINYDTTLNDNLRYHKKNQENEDEEQDIYQHRHKSLHLCGRLDMDASGLVLFTQDGTLARKINPHPDDINTTLEKEYIIGVKKHNQAQTWLNKCVKQYTSYNDNKNVIKSFQVLNPYQVRLVLSFNATLESKDVAPTLCSMADLKFRTMKLIRINKLKLGFLPTGSWRYFIPGKDEI